MEILLAKDMGFCWGVRRAIDIMEHAADQYGEIISVGPIVHNPQVVQQLEENLAALEVDLPNETVERIDQASAPRVPYPQSFYQQQMPRTQPAART